MAGKFECVEGHYTASSAADAINRAYNAKQIYHVQLGGKYSGDTEIAKDPQNGMLWLIKPGSDKVSPAAGIAEERASQAQREAAFSAVANELGLGMAIPKTFLVKIHEVPTAVMPFLPPEFKPLSVYKKKNPSLIAESFEKYRKSGMLHMWGILEWILGSIDSHSGNILMAPDGSVALIDHGSTFAGNAFDPALDESSFVPFYLRYRVEKGFKKLDPEDRMLKIVQLDARTDELVRNWLMHIDENRIGGIIKEFGINPEPSLARLRDLKAHEGSISHYVNKLWVLGNPLAHQQELMTVKSEIYKTVIKNAIVSNLLK